MEALIKHTGLVSPLDRMNVDTDAIIPKQFLKRIERTGFGQFLFYEFRFDEQGEIIPDFILNQDRYKGTSVLLSRANFGCGSSREHAPWALADYGFKVILAPSFADIFYNNCFNNGILPIAVANDTMDFLFDRCEKTPSYTLTIDLKEQLIYDEDGFEMDFDIDAFRKTKLINGLDDISLTLEKEAFIESFESKYKY